MIYPERLHAAAAAPRLADWVRYDKHGEVWWRDHDYQTYDGGPVPLLEVFACCECDCCKSRRCWHYKSEYYEIPRSDCNTHPTREAAIRAGLIALAER